MSIIHEEPDIAVVRKVLAGDVDAYGELMKRYEQKLLRYAVYLIHDQAAAADVVQETFISAYQNLNGFNEAYKFSSWIYRIAHNKAMNAVKKDRHISKDIVVEEATELSYEPTIMHEIDQSILQSDIQDCMNQLESKYREVLLLQYYEHMKYSDIADVLHMPVATVGVHVSRAKAKLKQLCEKKGVRHE